MQGLNFLEMVLGFDPEQKIMIVLGFVYHDLLLNALSVIPPQHVVGAMGGMKELTMTMGMIGMLVLILNRSLWNVKTILSWLVIMLLVTLGGRGDVLYTSLSDLGVVTQQTSLGAPQSPAGTVQTSYLAAAVAPKQTNNLTIPQAPTATGTPPPSATFATSGQSIMQQLKGLPGVTNDTQIGGFTPIVVTLYAFNRLNLLLLTTLKISAVDEIAKRMEKIPDIMFGNIVSPSAKAMVETYVQLCGDGYNLRTSPELLKDKIDPGSSASVYKKLESKKFNYNDLVKANNAYFNNVDPNIKKYAFPFFANDKDIQNYSALNKDAQDLLVTNEDSDTPHDAASMSKLVQAELDRRSGGQLGPNGNLAITALTNLPSSVGLDMQKPITLVTVAPQVENEFDLDVGEIKADLFAENCSDAAFVAATGNPIVGARLAYDECKSASDTISFNNCAELHAETHKRLIAATSKRQLEKDLMNSLVSKAIQSGIRNGRNELVADVAGLTDQQLILYAVREYETAKYAACTASGEGAGAAWEAFKSHWWKGSTCDDTNRDIEMLQKMLQAKAVRGTTTFYEQLYKSSYDPSSLFVSDFRKLASEAGALLGPIVLWFGSLFGGFGAGAYGGIVPHFMAFIIGFMIAVAPIMFLVGLLMPGWAFGILLTPVGVVAYMKMVEVMFTVVTSIFTMFKPAVTSDWVAVTADNEGFVNLQSAIYDIVVGLSYTSMFGVAGYVMFSMGNPGALMGAMKSIDSQAKIEFKDVLAAGAAVKGGVATVKGGYNNVRNVGKAAVKSADMISKGEIPVFGGPTFVSEALLESRAEIAKRATTRATLMEDGESFLARTQANAVDAADENRVKGEAALMRKQAGGGTISHESDGSITIKAQAANIKSEKADVDAKIANAKAIGGWQGVGQYRTSKETEADNKSWDEDVVELVQRLRANERQDLIANTTPGEQSELKQLEAYAKYFSTSDKSVKDLAKRLGFGNDVKDTFIRDNGIEYEGSGAFDVTKSFIRDVIKNANPNLSNDRYDSMANIEMLKILMANKFNRGGIITRSAPASVDTNFQPGDPNRITETTVTVNAQAPGMADFMARYAASVQNVVGGRLVGNDLNLSSSVRPKGTIRTP